jgi:hypothetical protein
MGRFSTLCLAVYCLIIISAGVVYATPSSEIWTPCIIDIQPAGKTHLDVDDYVRVGVNEQFATDVGLTFGSSIGKKLSIEYGFDLLTSTKDPAYFNAKIGYRENVLSKNAPALQLGFFDFGTKKDATDFDVIYLVTGKTLPDGKSRFHLAGYYGNPGSLRDSSGNSANTGFMIAFDRPLDKKGKWVAAADYASGKNFIGGGSVGLYYYFTKDITWLVGPVWFNDKGINGDMKWTSQFDINF